MDEIEGQLFNEEFYLQTYSDVRIAVENGEFASAYDHFLAFGDSTTEQRDPNAFFDHSLYLAENIDVTQAVNAGILKSALEHYSRFGDSENRDPSHIFDVSYYERINPDVVNAIAEGQFETSLEHYLKHGQFEGRSTIDPAFFDRNAYEQNNPDVVAAGVDPRQHYEEFGESEGRTTGSAFFDPEFYILRNPDVAEAVAAGEFGILQHFLDEGIESDELRSPICNQFFKALAEEFPEIFTDVNNFNTLHDVDTTLSQFIEGVDNTLVEERISEHINGLTMTVTCDNIFTTDEAEDIVITINPPVFSGLPTPPPAAPAGNNNPVANDDNDSTLNNVTLNIDALTNDTDPDVGDVLTITAAPSPSALGATVSINGAGPTTTIDYDPTASGILSGLGAGATTVDTFTYTISDGAGGSDTATVTITVTGAAAANNPPVGNNDGANATEDGAVVNIDVLANDTDPDNGDTLSILSADSSTSQNASVSIIGAGTTATLDYDHTGLFQDLAVGETTTDTFTYTVQDSNSATDTATVTVTITGINDDPIANDDNGAVDNNVTIIINALVNDSDVDTSDTLTILSADTSTSQNAAVSILGVGSTTTLQYDPTGSGTLQALGPGATTTDTFNYTVSDGNGGTDTATVTITVTGFTNNPPVANNDSDSTDEESPINIDALANDSDPDNGDTISITNVGLTSTLGASLSINGAGTTTTIDYDPTGSATLQALAVGASVTDTFSYTIEDSNSATDTATISITVTGVNDAPNANNDSANATEDGPVVNINVLGNDTDIDVGDTLSILSADSSTGQNATVSIIGAGTTSTLEYDHTGLFEDLALGATTTDTFTYTIEDNNGATDTATVTVTITGTNDAPNANGDSGATDEDNSIIINALANDTDPDTGDTLTISGVASPSTLGAAINIVGAGTTATLNYNPTGSATLQALALGATTTDTFTYTLQDNNGATDTATVTVTVTGLNDDPVANDDNDSTFNDSTVNVDVLANDTDVDSGDTVTILSADTTSALGGLITIIGAGVTATVEYDPTPSVFLSGLAGGATTTDTFTYTVEDTNGATDTATVTITVTGAIPAPPPETPPSDLSGLNGVNGFRIDGIAFADESGRGVGSGGDINGDGFSDLLIGAPNADPGASNYAGEAYVVFGGPGPFLNPFPLSNLNGTNGFSITGVDVNDFLGLSVNTAGDINGDGIDDIVIGAPDDDPGGLGDAGSSYVIFGSTGAFAASISIASLNGTNGFRIDGVGLGDDSGFSADSAGDINGDGIDDLIIGAYEASPGTDREGSSYIIFGDEQGFPATLDLATLDGNNGFRLDGFDQIDFSGRSVSTAGDVNGDGFEDIIIGADGAENTGPLTGSSYVVFGSYSGFEATINLSTLNGTNGFRLDSAVFNERSGFYVNSAGDVNSDGFDDVIINAIAGQSYVVFGAASGFAATLNLSTLNGTNGFALTGASHDLYGGSSVSTSGDINGDGFDDIIIGSKLATSGGLVEAGETYVVFGGTGFAASIDLTTLNGTNGLIIEGIVAGDNSGSAVSTINDFDGDGFDDIITSAIYADPLAVPNAGSSYAIFGGNFTSSVNIGGSNAADNLTGTAVSEVIIADRGDDTIDGGGGADTLIGAEGDDIFIFDGNDRVLKGGLGTDSIQITTTSDLTTITRFEEIETLDISGAGTELTVNALKLQDVRTINGAAGTQTIIFTDLSVIENRGTNGQVEVFQLNEDVTLVMDENNLTGVTSVVGADSSESGNTELAIINIEGSGANLNVSALTATNLEGFVINGEDGNNDLTGHNATFDTIDGGAGNDSILGLDGDDSLVGGDGDDTIDGGIGDDTINGGDGNDVISESFGNSVIDGGDGNDTISGSVGANTLSGGLGNDSITAGLGSNTITGGNGADTITSGGLLINPSQIDYTDINDGDALGSIVAANADSINNFLPGTDNIRFDDAAMGLNGGTATVASVAGGTANSTGTNGVFYINDTTADLTNLLSLILAVGTINIDAGDDLIFALNSNSSAETGIYYFQDQNGNNFIDGTELTLLGIVDNVLTAADLEVI